MLKMLRKIYTQTISLTPNKFKFIAINHCLAIQQNCTDDTANAYQKMSFPLNHQQHIKPSKVTHDTETASKFMSKKVHLRKSQQLNTINFTFSSQTLNFSLI